MKDLVARRVGRFISFGKLALVVATFTASPAAADVYRWDNGALIPGTEGITPGPDVQLDHRELEYAALSQKNLPGANFESSNLADSRFEFANLYYADLEHTKLTNANLTGANLDNANLNFSTLTNANLTGANLAETFLVSSTLTNANLTGANLRNTSLSYSTLTNANLSGADVIGASFYDTTSRGFTKEQFYSTASYQAKILLGIELSANDLSGWNFSGQNLISAFLAGSTFTSANLTEANLAIANLYSSKFTGADLTGANLANAYSDQSTFTNAKLDFADMRGARSLRLADATSRSAILPDGSVAGLNLAAGEQLVIRNFLGDRPIPVTIQDQMMIESGSVLQTIFDANPWGSLISFEPGTPVQLGGTLELTFADDMDIAAQIGRKLRVFDWTGVEPTGSFQIAGPFQWDTANLYSTGEVTLIQVPEPTTLAISIIAGLTMLMWCNRLSSIRDSAASW